MLLGSSQFPRAPGLSSPPSFANSARDIHRYFVDGAGIASSRILDRFDSDCSPLELLTDLEEFLLTHIRPGNPEFALDVILYYVGHGGFGGPHREYYLAIRATRSGQEGISSIRMSDLAHVLNEHAVSLRRYLVLDCCFAASAYTEFQSGPLAVAVAKTEDVLPPRGTALLCAAGRSSAAEAPEGAPYTMFTGALLNVLRTGDPDGDPWWTLTDIGDRVRRYIVEHYAGDAVRPEILSPKQTYGDLARDIYMFRNPGRRLPPTIGAAEAEEPPARDTPSSEVALSAAMPSAVGISPLVDHGPELHAGDNVAAAQRTITITDLSEPPTMVPAGAGQPPARDTPSSEVMLSKAMPSAVSTSPLVDHGPGLHAGDNVAATQRTITITDLPEPLYSAATVPDLLAAWKAVAAASITATGSSEQVSVRRSTTRLSIAVPAMLSVVIIAVAVLCVVLAWIESRILFSRYLLNWAAIGSSILVASSLSGVLWWLGQRFVRSRRNALRRQINDYPEDLLTMSVTRRVASARIMQSALHSWQVKPHQRVIDDLQNELFHVIIDAKKRMAISVADQYSLKRHLAKTDDELVASALAARRGSVENSKLHLRAGCDYAEQFKLTAKTFHIAKEMRHKIENAPEKQRVLEMTMFRSASAAFIHLGEV